MNLSILWTSLARGFDQSYQAIDFGAALICFLSLGLMLTWDKWISVQWPKLKLIPSALLVVMLGVALNEYVLPHIDHPLAPEHLVQVPYDGQWSTFFASLSFPDFSLLSHGIFWKVVFTIAIVASLETLLSIDAAIKIDPLQRNCNQNKELLAQGAGNMLCDLFGGLPITAVIVRTSANVAAGGLYKWSAVFHGFWLLLAVNLMPDLITKIPLASLAAILLLVGYKLTSAQVLIKMYRKGMMQFIPFATTIAAILMTDLLIGVIIGMMIGVTFIIKRSSKRVMVMTQLEDHYLLRFMKDVTFINKSQLRQLLLALPDSCNLTIDGSRSVMIDDDIIETIEEFQRSGPNRGINITLNKSALALSPYFKDPISMIG